MSRDWPEVLGEFEWLLGGGVPVESACRRLGYARAQSVLRAYERAQLPPPAKLIAAAYQERQQVGAC